MRIDNAEIGTRCWRTDHNQGRLINAARELAHLKHGGNSIEAIDADSPRWLAILLEEVGEVAHTQTYDAFDSESTSAQALADELLDVMAVAGAWLDALRAQGVRPTLATTGQVWLA